MAEKRQEQRRMDKSVPGHFLCRWKGKPQKRRGKSIFGQSSLVTSSKPWLRSIVRHRKGVGLVRRIPGLSLLFIAKLTREIVILATVLLRIRAAKCCPLPRQTKKVTKAESNVFRLFDGPRRLSGVLEAAHILPDL